MVENATRQKDKPSACESAWGPDADWCDNRLIFQRRTGSTSRAYSQRGGESCNLVIRSGPYRRAKKADAVAMTLRALQGKNWLPVPLKVTSTEAVSDPDEDQYEDREEDEEA
jgi:hypothetical protein